MSCVDPCSELKRINPVFIQVCGDRKQVFKQVFKYFLKQANKQGGKTCLLVSDFGNPSL